MSRASVTYYQKVLTQRNRGGFFRTYHREFDSLGLYLHGVLDGRIITRTIAHKLVQQEFQRTQQVLDFRQGEVVGVLKSPKDSINTSNIAFNTCYSVVRSVTRHPQGTSEQQTANSYQINRSKGNRRSRISIKDLDPVQELPSLLIDVTKPTEAFYIVCVQDAELIVLFTRSNIFSSTLEVLVDQIEAGKSIKTLYKFGALCRKDAHKDSAHYLLLPLDRTKT